VRRSADCQQLLDGKSLRIQSRLHKNDVVIKLSSCRRKALT
jgi:hypothetical protein